MNNCLLEATDLSKRYGRRTALDHLNLGLEAGRIVGLLGPNGSGKTTFIKTVMGLLTPTEGRLTIDGLPPGRAANALISYLPDRLYFDKHMKVSALIAKMADFYPDFDESQAHVLLSTMRIDVESTFKELSKGMIEKVQLVLVMSRRAKLYLLDEPIGGVDPAARDTIIQTIITNYNPKALVLIATHLIADVEPVLDEVVFIRDGRALLHKSVDDLRDEQGKSVDDYFREVFKC
jgi:ABC-2 type transport system ATP-binding protein